MIEPDQGRVRRILALSDIHVDAQENASWIQALSATDYLHDALILGGDVSANLRTLRNVLVGLKAKFAQVFFVPGNHELWISGRESADSMAKFFQVLDLCSSLGVITHPARVGVITGNGGVWIVPLFSWYRKPEEGEESLFMVKEGEDPTLDIWVDDHLTKWSSLKKGTSVADAFLRMNEETLQRKYDAPVISFSHFLPRRELILGSRDPSEPGVEDLNPGFNFSRVAGCADLDKQIRRLGSIIHVYGHQHRNRDRRIDGIRYVSHCLGYPKERAGGQVRNLGNGPLSIWGG